MITTILNVILALLTIAGKATELMEKRKIADDISSKTKLRVYAAKEKVRKKLVDRNKELGLH